MTETKTEELTLSTEQATRFQRVADRMPYGPVHTVGVGRYLAEVTVDDLLDYLDRLVDSEREAFDDMNRAAELIQRWTT